MPGCSKRTVANFCCGSCRHAGFVRSGEVDFWRDAVTGIGRQTEVSGRPGTAESLQKEVPDYFGDFTPGDRRWPMVLEAYGDYVKAICEHPSVEENLALMSESYASLVSKEDLRASIDFYSSTAGQSLVTAH
jgi:hypothetical protein